MRTRPSARHRFKFIHAADIHLDSPMRGLEAYEGAPVGALRGATRQAFERLIELALREEVEFVLFSGDLFDGDWKDYNTGLFFVAQLRRLSDAHIRVFITHGNHDAASRMTRSLKLPELVEVFPHTRARVVKLDDLEVAIHGQSFGTQAVTDDLSMAYPAPIPGYFNIGMLHTCLEGAEGHEPYAPCKLGNLVARGYDYWALGHVHKREILHTDPYVAYPGNLQGRHARELGEKGCLLVTVDEGRVQEVQFQAVDVVRWEHCLVDVSAAQTPDECLQCVSRALSAALKRVDDRYLAARVELVGRTSAHTALQARREHWRNECLSLANGLSDTLWIEKVRISTQSVVTRSRTTASDDPMSALISGLETLQNDPQSLEQLSSILSALNNKLPPELRDGEDAIALTSSEYLVSILPEVQQLLLDRLQQTGEN
jgi:DNA repair exonuclease SbcCD nuclease subunit